MPKMREKENTPAEGSCWQGKEGMEDDRKMMSMGGWDHNKTLYQ